jgi:hypothetical protein
MCLLPVYAVHVAGHMYLPHVPHVQPLLMASKHEAHLLHVTTEFCQGVTQLELSHDGQHCQMTITATAFLTMLSS